MCLVMSIAKYGMSNFLHCPKFEQLLLDSSSYVCSYEYWETCNVSFPTLSGVCTIVGLSISELDEKKCDTWLVTLKKKIRNIIN